MILGILVITVILMIIYQFYVLGRMFVRSVYKHFLIKEKDLLPEAVLPDYTYWITARTSNTWSHEKKLEALRKFI